MGLAIRDKLVYGSTSVSGGLGIEPSEEKAKIFVYDISAGRKIKEFIPDFPSSAGNVKISHAEVETLDIEVSSAGNISGTYIAKTAEIDASSAGTVDITLTAIEAECDASSSANIILAGSAEKLEADASSAGDIRAKKFVAEVVDAEASSGADIYVQATKRIDARASSGGDICYTGDATNINRSTSSGGSVKKK